ncbi:MAG TPA: SMC-Scp complex subunit ScpB, partial [Propionibacteriaceae bacterium]|nr:SMC-Scp complex subunit ScpB [Propionibacteriaceae bacterium]
MVSEENLELSTLEVAVGAGDADNSGSVAGALEALLLLTAEPVTEFELAQAVGVPESVVAETLAELVAFYTETGRGFELRQVGGGWRYYTREEYADLITRYVMDG